MTPVALTIAGSDPSGGAGLQADLKSFQAFGVYGTSVVTVVTVQNTVRSSRVEALDAALVGEQLDAVLQDIPPKAAKTGALGTAAIVEAVAARSFGGPLVIDPVMVGKHGGMLIAGDARRAMVKLLFPKAALVMPNLDEVRELTGLEVREIGQMRDAAKRVADLGPASVLVKGGHLEGPEAVDILWHDGEFLELRTPRIDSRHTHGTGCVYSAAITAGLALGQPLPEAARQAKAFLHDAIRTAPGLGAGHGPLNITRL
ncbi:MAG TPA: bifunctional hydroxymethylpyrimidine kinase/phosphomethylpyrimidine kinase [Bryobacteraceae bacterium]|nr:bifunctional hydroxymethylpyrimidine kinase/phosphomethylpyrimidine kinase [Bryobacteraceae bacterium]HWB99015.1 bifunctional hydroxymethylpyrimidine kinase/phosphomethylpyrimidine kinase [Bryobacteraceae bacterium]